MAGQRAPGQKLIPVPVDEGFLKEIDSALKDSEYDNRSEFIRDAIVEKLRRMGKTVTTALSKAPARFGKGGRPTEVNSKKTVADGAARLFQKAAPAAHGASLQPAPKETPPAGGPQHPNPPTPVGRPQKKHSR